MNNKQAKKLRKLANQTKQPYKDVKKLYKQIARNEDINLTSKLPTS